jgi:hypothetical protein
VSWRHALTNEEVTMKFSDIPAEAIELLKTWRYDRIIEKHEGPERWSSFLEWGELELTPVGEHWVLLPRSFENPKPVEILRWYPSPDGKSLTIFLKDLTLEEYYGKDPEWVWAGFLAICDELPGSGIFAAVVYHEWFIVEN